MPTFVILILLFGVISVALENYALAQYYYPDQKNKVSEKKKAIVKPKMRLLSTAFLNDGKIPKEYTCDGKNHSPPLSFMDIPKNAKSLALIMDDPDAPGGTFTHWFVWNISPQKSQLAKGEKVTFPQGITSFGKSGYGGPCPPSGTHRYFFKLYALDTMLDLKSNSTKQDLEKAMKGHILEQSTLIGKYSRT